MHVKYKVHKLHGRYILKYIILSCAGKQGIVVIVACKRLTPPPQRVTANALLTPMCSSIAGLQVPVRLSLGRVWTSTRGTATLDLDCLWC